MKWSFSEKDNGFVGYSVHRDFRGERADFQTRKLTFVDKFRCNIIWIMETLWIHCHVRKFLRKNALCNQYTVNKRRPVVQRPSRLKSKNSRTPAGWPSQRGIHLSNFDDSSILLRRVGVAENFERCEDFLKSNSSRTLSRRSVACPAAEPIEKWHFEDFDRMPILTWHASQ